MNRLRSKSKKEDVRKITMLVEASTRGDGDVGEVITHNIPAFHNVPTSIPHKGRLGITGEGFIHKDDFENMKVEVLAKEDKAACNARNENKKWIWFPVDYVNRTLSVQRQLGKKLKGKKEDFAPKTFTKQEVV